MDQEAELEEWIAKLKSGEELAAEKIWQGYFQRVRALAEKKLGSLPQRDRDAEDVALSALNALCVGARDGKFQRLEDSNDLWQILAMITSRKAANAWRRQTNRLEVGESIFGNPLEKDSAGMNQVSDNRDQQEIEQTLSNVSAELLSGLDDKQRQVAAYRLQGFSNDEIAEKMNVSIRSVERYLQMIRLQWEKHHA